MQTEQLNTLASLTTVQEFLDEHAGRLPSLVNNGARKRLDAFVAELTTNRSDQSGHAIIGKSITNRQEELRRQLVTDFMSPIARIARTDLPAVPEVAALRMPRGKLSIGKLATAAYGMAEAAAAYTAVFVANGLPADFLDGLKSAADAAMQSVTTKSKSRGKRTGATTGLKQNLSAARKMVHVLDAFVKRDLAHDRPLLAEWRTAMRVVKSTRGSAVGTRAPSPVVPAAPAASAAA